jgi:hypothetical protein
MSMPCAWSAIVSVTIGHQGVHALECERLARIWPQVSFLSQGKNADAAAVYWYRELLVGHGRAQVASRTREPRSRGQP